MASRRSHEPEILELGNVLGERVVPHPLAVPSDFLNFERVPLASGYCENLLDIHILIVEFLLWGPGIFCGLGT